MPQQREIVCAHHGYRRCALREGVWRQVDRREGWDHVVHGDIVATWDLLYYHGRGGHLVGPQFAVVVEDDGYPRLVPIRAFRDHDGWRLTLKDGSIQRVPGPVVMCAAGAGSHVRVKCIHQSRARLRT
jgi:hypothetical protein